MNTRPPIQTLSHAIQVIAIRPCIFICFLKWQSGLEMCKYSFLDQGNETSFRMLCICIRKWHKISHAQFGLLLTVTSIAIDSRTWSPSNLRIFLFCCTKYFNFYSLTTLTLDIWIFNDLSLIVKNTLRQCVCCYFVVLVLYMYRKILEITTAYLLKHN